MVRKIKWTDEASTELEEILTFYVKRNGNVNYSRKLRAMFSETLMYVCNNPFIGKSTEYKDVKYIVVHPNYSIFYTYNDKEIIVIAVWDNRRDPQLIKKKLSE